MIGWIAISIFISTIIYILLNTKKKNFKWNFVLCLGLLPYIFILLGAIHSFFNGSGLVGDDGGFSSAIFVIIVYLVLLWYIYIPAFLLIILAIINKKKQNNK